MKKNTLPTIGLGLIFLSFIVALFMIPNQDRARAKMYDSVDTLSVQYESKMQELKCIQCRAFHERMLYAVKYDDADVYDEAIQASDAIVSTHYGYINEICYMPHEGVTCIDEAYPTGLSIDI